MPTFTVMVDSLVIVDLMKILVPLPSYVKKVSINALAVLGGTRDATPLGPNSFNFMQFSGEK